MVKSIRIPQIRRCFKNKFMTYILFEIGFCEFKRVEKSIGSSQSHVITKTKIIKLVSTMYYFYSKLLNLQFKITYM